MDAIDLMDEFDSGAERHEIAKPCGCNRPFRCRTAAGSAGTGAARLAVQERGCSHGGATPHGGDRPHGRIKPRRSSTAWRSRAGWNRPFRCRTAAGSASTGAAPLPVQERGCSHVGATPHGRDRPHGGIQTPRGTDRRQKPCGYNPPFRSRTAGVRRPKAQFLYPFRNANADLASTASCCRSFARSNRGRVLNSDNLRPAPHGRDIPHRGIQTPRGTDGTEKPCGCNPPFRSRTAGVRRPKAQFLCPFRNANADLASTASCCRSFARSNRGRVLNSDNLRPTDCHENRSSIRPHTCGNSWLVGASEITSGYL